MKLLFVDWEIEKVTEEDFQGYDFRYYLGEVIEEYNDGTGKCKILLRTNDIKEIENMFTSLYDKYGCKNINLIDNDSYRALLNNLIEEIKKYNIEVKNND